MEESTLHPRRNDTQAARTQPYPRILADSGLRLASASTLELVAEGALDAGRKLSGAEVGVCCFRDGGPQAATDPGFKALGISSAGIQSPQYPGWERYLESLFSTHGPLPPDHVLFGLESERAFPFREFFPEYAPVRSCFGLPIQNHKGERLGLLVFGHSLPGAIHEGAESLVAAVAVQAGLAMDHLLMQARFEGEAARAEHARGEQRDTARRLKQVLEAAQLGTWSWDAGSGLIHFDERGAELFGVPQGVPVSRKELREHMLLPEDLHRSPADLRTVLAAGGTYTAEYRIRNAAGEERWIAANGNASTGPGGGRFAGMIGTLQDITSRKLQEESLRTSEKLAATGRLAATIAHEINNPLEAVTNLIYLAKTDATTPPSVSRMLETADKELARVSQIAQQTLGFYRDTSRPVSVDLNDLLQAVVDLFDRKLTGKRLQCTLDLEPSLSVVGLGGEIRQVVSNLLVNAIDASVAGSPIHIRARRRPRNGNPGVSMVISDQGSGIPHNVRHRLFTPFTTTKQALGTGLGLWVTQGIVEKHGGSVRFRSRTDVPSGTVFRVYLPESGHPRLFAQQRTSIVQ